MFKKIQILLLSLILCGCSLFPSGQSEPVSRTGFVLGTVVSVKLLENGSEKILDQVFERLTDIENHMSVNIETSDIFQLNKLGSFKVSDDTLNVLEAGLEFGDLSDGKFDISMGPIVDLWKIGTEDAHVPDPEEVKDQLQYVDYKQIMVSGNTVTIPQGAKIDLGGIAKGYAADEVSKILFENDVKRAIINLGGNIKVIGNKAEGTPYNIGIQGPEEMRNDYLGIVEVEDKTVVTSGDYERYFVEDGVKYHHIFDSTGYPFVTNVASVSVITESSMMADALSTILFLSSIEEGIALVNSLDGVECIYVTKENQLYFSSQELKNLFTLTDLEFTIQ